ncbi:hypothetical protein N7532_004326 [Penicillium argentinense]|uniref:Uncharacterized protein n=1 Tax=Penicillium argentinense TaxID=1131581 RepID=A0A9W9FP56_9EURO|nr:uncharacterized protein N7532_004326 [Penicillium argentinense]KAJ5103797.1 hypothetical protein N7532_004326 [Penicillium argentinense]
MHTYLPAIIFLVSTFWGFYGEIPFTAIQTARPWTQRTLAGVQLANSAYVLHQLIPSSTADYGIISLSSTPIIDGTTTLKSNDTVPVQPPAASIFPTITPIPPIIPIPLRAPATATQKEVAGYPEWYQNAFLFLMLGNFSMLVKLFMERAEGRNQVFHLTLQIERTQQELLRSQQEFIRAMFRSLVETEIPLAISQASAGLGYELSLNNRRLGAVEKLVQLLQQRVDTSLEEFQAAMHSRPTHNMKSDCHDVEEAGVENTNGSRL